MFCIIPVSMASNFPPLPSVLPSAGTPGFGDSDEQTDPASVLCPNGPIQNEIPSSPLCAASGAEPGLLLSIRPTLRSLPMTASPAWKYTLQVPIVARQAIISTSDQYANRFHRSLD
jgi:hypothetical protein